MREVVDAVVARAVERWGAGGHERADVVWRHRASDLAPFSRGEGPATAVGAVSAGAPAGPGAVAEGRRSARGRLAEAGVAEGLVDRRAQARLAAGQGAHRARGLPAR